MKRRARKRSGKKPALTSPWKIGAFVALQLVFVGISVGYFLVTVYHVKLQWLEAGSNVWRIDSYLFFRQMYPLVAAVVIIALMSYFIVASAVRRYKCYLDSGQDYRKMIALAESIDDLTNPAQIARLSAYPELQAVLRNYGDSIREISHELNQKEESIDHGEFERQINALLRGTSAKDAGAGKAWESVYRSVRDRFENDRKRIDELEARGGADRAAIGGAALAYGRVMEAISGAGEDLLEITKGVNDLRGVVGEIADRAPAPASDAGPQPRTFKSILADMEKSIRKLEEGGHILHEFSEENNGIALNMALMAAKGSVGEHDLANFAEGVRGTAERFRQLNNTIVGIAQGLLAGCYGLKETAGEPSPSQCEEDPQVQQRMIEILRIIEDRSNLLQKRVCSLASELQDVQGLLQKDFTASDRSGAAGTIVGEHGQGVSAEARPAASAHVVASQAEGREGEAGPAFVIDHGKSWGGISTETREAQEPTPQEEEALSSGEEAQAAPAEGPLASDGEPEGTAPGDFSDMTTLRDLKGTAEDREVHEEPREEPRPDDGSWMEMPGHRWLKIDVEKAEAEEEQRPVQVTVQHEPEPSAVRTGKDVPVTQGAADRRDATTVGAAEEGEPVYDLFELGAVEYVEEIQAQR